MSQTSPNRTWPNYATKDHATPLSKGGSDLDRNIVDACLGCNASKNCKTVEEYRWCLFLKTTPGKTVHLLRKAMATGVIKDCSLVESTIDSILVANPMKKFWGEL